MTFLLGLTGSIGMGKSTTAEMFRQEGIPVWDADAVVHQLYAPGGRAVEMIAQDYPQVIEDGGVSRSKLRNLISTDAEVLRKIEAIVHPIVAAQRADYIAGLESEIVLFDIPLLFEAHYETWLDAVVCVTAPANIQRERVMSRPGMTEEAFKMILSKQMPDAQKRARSDYVIEAVDMDSTREKVRAVIADVRKRIAANA